MAKAKADAVIGGNDLVAVPRKSIVVNKDGHAVIRDAALSKALTTAAKRSKGGKQSALGIVVQSW